MPPKKSSGLGRKPRRISSKAKDREKETPLQSQERLQKAKVYKAERRQNESQEEKVERRSKDAFMRNKSLMSMKKDDIKVRQENLRRAQVNFELRTKTV